MNLLRKGTFARKMLFIQSKNFISTNTQPVQSIICPQKKPKILQHSKVYVFADVCGALTCSCPLMCLQRGTELGELLAAKGQRSHNPSRHPPSCAVFLFRHQVYGGAPRKGPSHPQLALGLACSSCKNNQQG